MKKRKFLSLNTIGYQQAKWKCFLLSRPCVCQVIVKIYIFAISTFSEPFQSSLISFLLDLLLLSDNTNFVAVAVQFTFINV